MNHKQLYQEFLDYQIDLSIKYEKIIEMHKRIKTIFNFPIASDVIDLKVDSPNFFLNQDFSDVKFSALVCLKIIDTIESMKKLINEYSIILSKLHIVNDYYYRSKYKLLHTIRRQNIDKYTKLFKRARYNIEMAYNNEYNQNDHNIEYPKKETTVTFME
ncbi:hypothetical protein JO84_gp032 [Aureococcus anophagefferens virus]|uniref:Uncharacterized protein n=1 Tax=Aureococcus anophagefferens virus TaxID=1474867 RepID=A0A076FFK7_9VIRU|nr:hypothetical protein JO84_gp032 [Aureococcus anophagefferens virus]AII17044.1 hypothetical protein AaV_032 [Aureococcus anophagefferens virus]UOG94334.1 hypothetical protein MKD35_299 [Aureococcus anophagefferens virus]